MLSASTVPSLIPSASSALKSLSSPILRSTMFNADGTALASGNPIMLPPASIPSPIAMLGDAKAKMESRRLRTASELFNVGVINSRQKAIIKDLLAYNNADPKLAEALSRFESTGDSSMIVELVKQGVLSNRKSSLDLLGELGDMNLDMIIGGISKEIDNANDYYYEDDPNVSSLSSPMKLAMSNRSPFQQKRPRIISASSTSSIDQFSPEFMVNIPNASSQPLRRKNTESFIGSSDQSPFPVNPNPSDFHNDMLLEFSPLKSPSFHLPMNSMISTHAANAAAAAMQASKLAMQNMPQLSSGLTPLIYGGGSSVYANRMHSDSLAFDPTQLGSPSFKAQLFGEENDSSIPLGSNSPSIVINQKGVPVLYRQNEEKKEQKNFHQTVSRDRVPKALRERIERETKAVSNQRTTQRTRKEESDIENEEEEEDIDEDDDDDDFDGKERKQKTLKRKRGAATTSTMGRTTPIRDSRTDNNAQRGSSLRTPVSSTRGSAPSSAASSSQKLGSKSLRSGTNSPADMISTSQGTMPFQNRVRNLNIHDQLFINGTIVVATTENVKGPGYVGLYSPEARKIRIEAYVARKKSQAFKKKVKYRIR